MVFRLCFTHPPCIREAAGVWCLAWTTELGLGMGWAAGGSPQALDGCPWDGRGLQVDIHVLGMGLIWDLKNACGLWRRFTANIQIWLVDP